MCATLQLCFFVTLLATLRENGCNYRREIFTIDWHGMHPVVGRRAKLAKPGITHFIGFQA